VIRSRALLGIVVGLALVAATLSARASWLEGSVGEPLIQRIDARAINPSLDKWTVTQDRYGRLFTSDDQMHMFDGESWHTFTVPGSYAVRTLRFDDADRLWVSAFNEVGYFEETTVGHFTYRSLSDQLPANRDLGHIWGSALVGPHVYFICDKKILRWDGHTFRTWEFPGALRLFPIQHRGETWFHHVPTGLYRLTADGPQLERPASALPQKGIFGLQENPHGLLVVSSLGFHWAGEPLTPVHGEALNQRIAEARLSSVTTLPSGEFALGTLNQGILLVDAQGRTRQLSEGPEGLPAGPVLFLHADQHARVWGIVHNTPFHFDASTTVSAFDQRNGLTGNTVRDVRLVDGQIHAIDQTGIARLVGADAPRGAHFQALKLPKELYHRLEPAPEGFLAARFGGIDWIHPEGVASTSLPGVAIFGLQNRPQNRTETWLVGSQHLDKLSHATNRAPTLEHLVRLPDEGGSLHEDSTGRVWISTASRGVFTYEPATQQLNLFQAPTVSPVLGAHSLVVGYPDGIFIFVPAGIFHAAADGSGATRLTGVPAIEAKAARLAPDGRTLVVAFTQIGANSLPVSGLATLRLDSAGAAQWQELDATAVHALGPISALEFSREAGRELLWTASSRGVLRLDYASLAPAKAPAPPLIRLTTPPPGRTAAGPPTFAFARHRVGFTSFTSDFALSRDWLTQVRLGHGEWSTPAPRIHYEFTNLSEGDYRFEIRAVTPAGRPGEASGYSFRILPPWYRSSWAYAGSVAAVMVTGLAVIRWRERRSRARTRELENLVKLRTHELEKASAAKDEFLATISHEIRNPMNGVIGIAESFDLSHLDAAERHKFTLLRHCASHLSSLLEDILDLSRAQAGRLDLENIPFDPHELAASIAAITAGESARAGLPVEVAVSPAVPRRVVGDPRRVRQILLNLVGNALKFAGRGTIEVTAWCHAAGPGRTELIFTVADDGPGISPEEQAKLFLRFERGAEAVARHVPGTGLGLALCKSLAEKMGGRLWVESEPGHGACFYFSATFPVAAEPVTLEHARDAVPTESASANTPTRRALVVDDEEYNRLALGELLGACGVAAASAADGPAALALARTHAYDVIFLDHQLPGRSGVEIARARRAAGGASAHAALVATTAFDSDEKRAECVAAGMSGFLAKPVTAARLRAVLDALFRDAPDSTPALAQPSSVAAAGFDAMETGLRLRQLAEKTGRPYREELALFLAELDTAQAGLTAALAQQDAAGASRFTHQLYGGLAFVGAQPAAQLGREIERSVVTGEWPRARQQAVELAALLSSLRSNLLAPPPVYPAASRRA
jgi:signal transduction histidine kinase/CheY-like chemotaxis protein/HPt (histidine-containing phosphotransfer) domain-containing protein